VKNLFQSLPFKFNLQRYTAVLGAARPAVRAAAGRSAWDIVSTGKPDLSLHAGVVSAVELADIQGEDFSAAPTVVGLCRLNQVDP
jgi:hypothetical protein